MNVRAIVNFVVNISIGFCVQAKSEMKHTLSESYHTPCPSVTMVFLLSKSQAAYDMSPPYRPIIIFKYHIDHYARFSYFGRELEESRILYPHRFLGNKYGLDSTIFLHGMSPAENLRLAEYVLSEKIARPQFDCFIQNVAATAELSQTYQYDLNDRFRYIFYKSGNDFVPLSCDLTSNVICLRKLLGGREVKVTSTITPERMRFFYDHDGNLKGGGANFKMLQTFAQLLNSSNSYMEGGGIGHSGVRMSNGSWSGVVGDVFSRRAVIGTMLGPMAARDGVVDYSAAYDFYLRVFYVRTPKTGISWRAVYLSFDSFVWLIFALTLFIFIGVIHFAKRKILPIWSVRKFLGVEKISGSFGTVLRILLEQDVKCTGIGYITKCIVMLCLIFCLLMNTAYRSKLMSSLTNPIPLRIIPKTHEDLAHSNYKIVFRSYGGIALMFMNMSTNPMHKRIARRMALLGNSVQCLLKVLGDENIACMDYDAGGDFGIASNLTLSLLDSNEVLSRSDDSSFTSAVIWVFRKGSPLISGFNQLILQCSAGGLYNLWVKEDDIQIKSESSRWLRRQDTNRIKKDLEELDSSGYEQSPKPLNMNNFIGLKVLYICGIIEATALLVIEKLTMIVKLKQQTNGIEFLKDNGKDASKTK